MGKYLTVAVIIGMVIIAYLLLMVFETVIVDAVSTANTTMAATSNMSNYPGTQEGMLAIPWILWFVPGVGGIIAVVFTLRAP